MGAPNSPQRCGNGWISMVHDGEREEEMVFLFCQDLADIGNHLQTGTYIFNQLVNVW